MSLILNLFLNPAFPFQLIELALDLWKYSHCVNAVSCLIIFLVMMVDPPPFLQGSHAARYGQLTGIGFLSVGIQSYYALESQGLESTEMKEAAISATLSVVVYMLGFATLTWPLRIKKNSPPISAAEKFFCALAVVTSVGMIPSIVFFVTETAKN
uniref:Uncharacterized protein n=1 Tax=Pseudo-nitzschia delicatissima TaxID=44447 RepID=A0A7S0UGB6_9STRA